MRTLRPTTSRNLRQNLLDAQKEDGHIANIFPKLQEILSPYVGKPILKVDGNWLKKLGDPLYEALTENKPNGVHIYFGMGRYAIFLRSPGLLRFNLNATLCTITDINNLEKIVPYEPYFPESIDSLMEKIRATEKEAEEAYTRVQKINTRIPGVTFIQ